MVHQIAQQVISEKMEALGWLASGALHFKNQQEAGQISLPISPVAE